MSYDDNKGDRRRRSDEAWDEYFGKSTHGEQSRRSEPRTYIEPRASAPKKRKKGKKNVTAKLGKNARPIAVGLVAVLVAAVLIIAAVSSAGARVKPPTNRPPPRLPTRGITR